MAATIHADRGGHPISPYVYGQFVEHIGSLINSGLWAEMLDDRKFYFPIGSQPAALPSSGVRPGRGALRRWTAVGPADAVSMDVFRPYAGEQSPRVTLDASEARGIRQAGLALLAGKEYTGRVVLAGDPSARVIVSLVWGSGAEERQDAAVGPLAVAYGKFPFRFTAGADCADARLEVTGTGTGSFRIGAVSLMPADNTEGFRAEVVDALKSLRSGVYRFPGGNFVSAHEWRDAIGDVDRRPPIMDPVWNAVQPNDVGTHEFLTLCRLLDVEPYITVNAGLGDAWSAAQYVEYVNGAATTPMGRLRAEHGHPQPYGVEFWGIGNEAWGDWQFGAMSLEQFQVKHNLFAKAMRRVDPTIRLIASGAMPDAMTGSKQSLRLGGKIVPELLSPGDWTGGLLAHCLDGIDLISEHFYSYAGTRFDLAKAERVPIDPQEPLVEWMRRPANHVRAKYEAYQEYLARIPGLQKRPVPICLDEWAFAGVAPNSYKVVPAYAWVFHEMFRHSDLYQMAGFTFATSLVSADRTGAVLNPAGLLFKLYRDRFGTIPVEVTGNSKQPPPRYPAGGEQPQVNAGSDTFPLDVVAAWTSDRSALTVAVVNPTVTEQRLALSFEGVALATRGRLFRLAPATLDATIVVGQEPGVRVEERPVAGVPRTAVLPPWSVSIYELPVRREGTARAGADGAGAYATGRYRNLFVELGRTPREVEAKIAGAYQQLFHGDLATERLYFPSGENENGPLAYIPDIQHDDVRSEGMSYGMMIAVQLGKKAEFDALWNWSMTHMYHADPRHPSYGYFSWQLAYDGTVIDELPAPDGEEYYVMALYFAAHRWGSGKGIYDYKAQADRLLDHMVHRAPITGMVRQRGGPREHVVGKEVSDRHAMILFSPDERNRMTDASYHLPAFYELWARWGPERDRAFWARAANVSRDYFVRNTHPRTGLASNLGAFDGTPLGFRGPASAEFREDAWRVAMNWSVDWSWWAKDPRQQQLSDRIQAFFESQGLDGYGDNWKLDGTLVRPRHSPGLVATNGVASLAATDAARSRRFVDALWNLEVPKSQVFRYYDGLLYMMSLMHAAGRFRIIMPAAGSAGNGSHRPGERHATATATRRSSKLAW